MMLWEVQPCGETSLLGGDPRANLEIDAAATDLRYDISWRRLHELRPPQHRYRHRPKRHFVPTAKVELMLKAAERFR